MSIASLPFDYAEELLPSWLPYALPGIPLDGRLQFSLVLPTYQEAANILAVLDRTTAALDAISGLHYEVIVVDDDSPDGTWRLALARSYVHPSVRVVRRRGERGLATAVFRGWQFARGDVLGVMDADLQHPPELIAKLLSAIEQGADLAIGSRHVPGGGVSHWRWSRRLISRAAQFVGLLLLPNVLNRVRDPMSGCFLLKRSLLAGVETRPLGYKILLEVLARTRPRSIQEVGYIFEERPQGESKVAFVVYTEYLRQLWQLRSARE